MLLGYIDVNLHYMLSHLYNLCNSQYGPIYSSQLHYYLLSFSKFHALIN